MKRKRFLSIAAFFAAMVVMLALAACNGDSESSTTTPPPEVPPATTPPPPGNNSVVSGKVENANNEIAGNAGKIYAFNGMTGDKSVRWEIGSIDASGNFEFDLGLIDTSNLTLLTAMLNTNSVIDEIEPIINSNENAKFIMVEIVTVYNSLDYGLYEGVRIINEEYASSLYIYVDAAVTITGSRIVDYKGDGNPNDYVIEIFNYQFTAGWNVLHFYSEYDGTNETYYINSTKPANYYWLVAKSDYGGGDPTNDQGALTIQNNAGNTTVKITTNTIDNDTDFYTLTGVVATGQGSTPYLTWTNENLMNGKYNVMLHNPPVAPDGNPPYTIKYQNDVVFVDGSATVNWNTMTVQE